VRGVSILKLSILLVCTTLITACLVHGNAQRAEETPIIQEEPENQKAQDTPKQGMLNNEKGLKIVKTDWVEYEPAVVELEGRLINTMFFGPPNFGEDPETDSKEMTRILSLDKPINVRSRN
jgi:hypothetical protein